MGTDLLHPRFQQYGHVSNAAEHQKRHKTPTLGAPDSLPHAPATAGDAT